MEGIDQREALQGWENLTRGDQAVAWGQTWKSSCTEFSCWADWAGQFSQRETLQSPRSGAVGGMAVGVFSLVLVALSCA